MAYFPFMIDIGNKSCLVVGGGSIALHKVKILLPFGVHIKVVATDICEEMRQLEQALKSDEGAQTYFGAASKEQGTLEVEQRQFRDSDVEEMDFVVAATDDAACNHHISELCHRQNILVNVVDVKEDCSFIFPAMIKEKELLVAVSSGGQSPAAAAYVKKKLGSHIPDYYGDMIEQLGSYRDYVLEHVDTPGKRKELFNRLLSYGDAHGGDIPEQVVKAMVAEVSTNQSTL